MPSGNVNTAEVDDPKLNAKIDKAKQITEPERGREGVGRPRQGGHEPGLLHPWLWDNNVGLQSTNIKGVSSKFNSGAFDFAFSSLK